MPSRKPKSEFLFTTGRDRAMMPQKEEWRFLFEFSLEWVKSMAVQM
jgi:hypothetical protein